MNGIETIKKPIGQIDMILHKGGEYDIKTGKIVGGEIIAEKEVKNLIVNMASQLMACRLAPGSNVNVDAGDFLVDGLQFLAVGVGILNDPTKSYDKITNPVDTTKWDLQNPPVETLSTTKLTGELFRKAFTGWNFVAADGSDTNTPTNILKLVTTFYETDAVGPLTEMGLYGGNAQDWNDGAGKNSGYMFNYKTFPVWNKPADARLTITWKLTF